MRNATSSPTQNAAELEAFLQTATKSLLDNTAGVVDGKSPATRASSNPFANLRDLLNKSNG